MNPFLATDGYKTGHIFMYPENTQQVYSNFTPRSNRHAPNGIKDIVVFGPEMVMKQVDILFKEGFFNRPKYTVCKEIQEEYSLYLGTDYYIDHIESLHDLGYLPIAVKALPEGTIVSPGIPVLTIYNTEPEFFWLTNFLETLISNLLWKPMTSATIAYEYKKVLLQGALRTDSENLGFVDFQGHDFSMRGMDSLEATISSGLGHATSFLGSDSLPVIYGARKYYSAEGFVVGSVNATEHSVMCAGTREDEIGTFRYLMKKFPTGILSIVSDTWDLWKVCTEYLPLLKEEILKRDGKIVIRPDSGDPADIVCGYNSLEYYEITEDRQRNSEHPSYKGVVELLWDLFGGHVNAQGYKVLDSHIGVIYGDSITLSRAQEIITRLEKKGFASTNIVLGIGSFTYQYNTRDTFGFAMKATQVIVNDEERVIYKDPVTDDGTKKSAAGLLRVDLNSKGEYTLTDRVSNYEQVRGELQLIYMDGRFIRRTPFIDIRSRLTDKLRKQLDIK